MTLNPVNPDDKECKGVKTADFLVVDSGAFINNAPIKELGDSICTIQDVVNEIRDKRTRRNLQVLPYELKFRNPPDDIIKLVNEFAKKSGDYQSLSAVDIKVIALTYLLEKENGSIDKLNLAPQTPTIQQKEGQTTANYENLPGFFSKSTSANKKTDIKEETEGTVDKTKIPEAEEEEEESDDSCEGEEGKSEEEAFGDEDDDEGGWITAENIEEANRKMANCTLQNEHVKVACITTDFAVQNVLLQMGLKVIAVDGKLIRGVRTYLLRCYGCFKTTTNMEKIFCPKCGNRTLKRVAYSIDENGEKRLYINFKRPINTKGMNRSLPKPRGGKYANDPIVCEDQRIPHQKISNKARQKMDALDPDYVAGDHPFAMRDVVSRSAMLGYRNNNGILRRNAGESNLRIKKVGRRK